MKSLPSRFAIALLLTSTILAPTVGCSGEGADAATGGSSGGVATGGTGSGGGPLTGGAGAGGAASGGAGLGGTSAGGLGTGGLATGGANAGGSAAGGTGTGGQAGIPATFATIVDIVAGVYSEGCGAGSCHIGEADPHFSNNATLYQDLIDPTHTADDFCGGLALVVPGNPSQSAFFKAISEGCGEIGYMPNGCKPEDYNCLPAEVIAAVEAWIQAGAPAE